MQILKSKIGKNGSILLLSLWILVFLTMFAVQIGLTIRAKLSLVSRLEKRSQLHYLASAGIKKAIASLKYDLQRQNQVFTLEGKIYRHNNAYVFSNREMNFGKFDITYKDYDSINTTDYKKYGIVDEERKLNINTANKDELKRLFSFVLGVDDNKTQELAEALIDWREFGESEPTGFYSDEYYANLEYPYSPKNYDFEIIEELLLVQGFSNQVVKKLLPYITIFGDGQVNINTASKEILVALGLQEAVAEKLILVRRGNDGLEDTLDDAVFHNTFDIASIVKSVVELNEGEMRQIDLLNQAGKVKTNSQNFFIQSVATLDGAKNSLTAQCVYNSHKNRIEYWREKY